MGQVAWQFIDNDAVPCKEEGSVPGQLLKVVKQICPTSHE
jgi:hypothetical protein